MAKSIYLIVVSYNHEPEFAEAWEDHDLGKSRFEDLKEWHTEGRLYSCESFITKVNTYND